MQPPGHRAWLLGVLRESRSHRRGWDPNPQSSEQAGWKGTAATAAAAANRREVVGFPTPEPPKEELGRGGRRRLGSPHPKAGSRSRQLFPVSVEFRHIHCETTSPKTQPSC